MNIELNKQNELLKVTLNGRLDTNTSPAFESKVLTSLPLNSCIQFIRKSKFQPYI